jgi:hypothetical protein
MYPSFLTPAQGQGYILLRRLEDWLNTVYSDAMAQGQKVQGILTEAQKFLNC